MYPGLCPVVFDSSAGRLTQLGEVLHIDTAEQENQLEDVDVFLLPWGARIGEDAAQLVDGERAVRRGFRPDLVLAERIGRGVPFVDGVVEDGPYIAHVDRDGVDLAADVLLQGGEPLAVDVFQEDGAACESFHLSDGLPHRGYGAGGPALHADALLGDGVEIHPAGVFRRHCFQQPADLTGAGVLEPAGLLQLHGAGDNFREPGGEHAVYHRSIRPGIDLGALGPFGFETRHSGTEQHSGTETDLDF